MGDKNIYEQIREDTRKEQEAEKEREERLRQWNDDELKEKFNESDNLLIRMRGEK